MSYTYGLDKEIQEKIASKYDVNKEQAARKWIETVIKEPFPGTFQECLKSGVRLCKLINAIKPQSVRKYNMQQMPFMQRENIAKYLAACRSLGMNEVDMFDTQDLYEGKNMLAVVDHLFSLGAFSRTVKGFSGPYLGVKHSTKNERNFSPEVLARGKNMPTKVNQGNYDVHKKNQEVDGRPITLDRQIVQNLSDIKKDHEKRASQPVVSPMAKFCSSCGARRVSDDAKFCGQCGQKI